ncbi:ABC-type transport auxiliary lipoprotein family protein [Novosphingobium sp.]|uniref:ABC-type transport auxiliary lipoprotein family protein n=1 Tax=Novosphingobium sp. TaxID=1874826 RepID=UPI0035ADCD39
MPLMRTGNLRVLPALLALMALPGCLGLGGSKAPASLLGLTATEMPKAGTTASGKSSDMVLVMEPEADRRLSTVRIPVQVNDTQIAYLKDVQWVERPARMFTHLLAETLRARTGRLVLEEGQTAGAPGVRLSGQLVEMGYDARTGSVVVRFDALRTSATGEVITRRFEAVVPNVAPKPAEVGPALNTAANDVASQVADWLGN